MQEGVNKDRGVIVAPPHGILTKKMIVPAIVSGWVMVSSRGVGRGWVHLS